LVTGAAAQGLEVGAKAPAFALAKMVRGAPVASLPAGKVHLIEFWGTSAGAGFERFEEFAALRKTHGDKLAVVGVIGPDPEQYDFETVADYYRENGDSIDFTIGFDDGGKLHAAWVAAAAAEPPHVFLVDAKGNVAWSGGLGFLPLALPVVMKGDVDYAKLAAEQEAAKKKFIRLTFLASLKPAGTAKELDGFVARWPALAHLATTTAWGQLLEGDDPGLALQLCDRMVEVCSAAADAMHLNWVAWTLVDPELEWPDRMLAIDEKAAEKAVALTGGEDSSMLDTLARVAFWKQDFKQAVQLQQKAVAKAEDPDERAGLAVTLGEYQRLLDGK
jgi:hypothetical protein